ncbi:IS1-like element transposase [Photobacterium leiognathi]
MQLYYVYEAHKQNVREKIANIAMNHLGVRETA